MTIYLIPGQGADYRLFNNLSLKNNHKTVHINYEIPALNCDLKEYAELLMKQIDTSEKFSLIGSSLGGMICTELCELIKPEKTIIISSAKSWNELPFRFRFFKYIPIHKIIPKRIIKNGAKLAQPLVEPNHKIGKEIFKAMLNDKDPTFLKRTIDMIVTWKRKEYKESIIHIHGTNDHTIPIRNIKADYMIKNGSHMMIYTKGKELSELINRLLEE